MMKETTIEKEIKAYIEEQGGWCQRLHSGQLVVKKGGSTYAMHLADKGSPDLIACLYGHFFGIEVKKDSTEVLKWMRLNNRRKAGEKLPKSYHREEAQSKMAKEISDAGGYYLLVFSLEEFIATLENIKFDRYSWIDEKRKAKDKRIKRIKKGFSSDGVGYL